MISTRYLPGIAVLLSVALTPTILHTYVGATVADGRTSAAVADRLAGREGRSTGRSRAWALENFATTDFIERQYGSDLTLFVARSYDAKRLYHHPELAAAYGHSYKRGIWVRAAARPDVPLHVLTGEKSLSVYALLYGERLVENPIRFQLQNALALVVRPTQMMTLFFVRGRPASRPDRIGDLPAVSLVLAAIDSFVAQPHTRPK